MSGKFLTTKQLAARWRMSIGTLQNWRMHGIGPKYVKIEYLVLYSLSAVRQWESFHPHGVIRALKRGHQKATT